MKHTTLVQLLLALSASCFSLAPGCAPADGERDGDAGHDAANDGSNDHPSCFDIDIGGSMTSVCVIVLDEVGNDVTDAPETSIDQPVYLASIGSLISSARRDTDRPALGVDSHPIAAVSGQVEVEVHLGRAHWGVLTHLLSSSGCVESSLAAFATRALEEGTAFVSTPALCSAADAGSFALPPSFPCPSSFEAMNEVAFASAGMLGTLSGAFAGDRSTGWYCSLPTGESAIFVPDEVILTNDPPVCSDIELTPNPLEAGDTMMASIVGLADDYTPAHQTYIVDIFHCCESTGEYRFRVSVH